MSDYLEKMKEIREDELKMIGEQREQMLEDGFERNGREADE